MDQKSTLQPAISKGKLFPKIYSFSSRYDESKSKHWANLIDAIKLGQGHEDYAAKEKKKNVYEATYHADFQVK